MMTKSSGQSDDENTKSKISDAAKVAARDFWVERNRFRALELIEKTISDHGNHEKCFSHHELQGDIFYYQAMNTDDTDLKCVYLFASVDAYSMATLLYPYAMSSFPGYARSMIKLGDQLRIKKFYKKAVSKAKRGLLVTLPQGMSVEVFYFGKIKTELEKLYHLATEKMQAPVTVSDHTDCKMHILDNHVHTSEPKFSARPKYVDEILADMICWTVEHYKSTGIYEDVMPKGDKIVSWIFDCPEIGQDFVSQMAKGVHNRELWLAALRIVRCVVRKMERYYDKRHMMVTYEKMLNEAKTICDREDSRKNENQRSTYESVLRMKCEELVGKQDDDTKCFLTVVRDVFQRKSSPSFEVLEDKEECISKRSTTVPNDDVKKSLSTLKKSLKEKFPLIDSKILRNKSTYKKLIDVFPKLSAVEYRLVVLPFVKKFLQDKLKKMMKTNSSSVAAGGSAERKPKKRHLSNEG
ncbi:unnamed protein product [Arabidopsis arenosa]|uniref:Uncharacterized protein n=1 Tax=Arabidopsis arenosa TaxID=38785 RepID=A0A8S2A6W8_ARAAE|nr:unnamed protein product [Arabidopsis arenosa]